MVSVIVAARIASDRPAIHGLAREGAVEVDQMEPAGPGLGEAARLIGGVAVEDRRLPHLAAAQPHDRALLQIDGGVEDHGAASLPERWRQRLAAERLEIRAWDRQNRRGALWLAEARRDVNQESAGRRGANPCATAASAQSARSRRAVRYCSRSSGNPLLRWQPDGQESPFDKPGTRGGTRTSLAV